MNRDDGYLLDILLAAEDILSFKADTDREAFRRDLECQAAILYKLTVIGEAVRMLSPALKEAHLHIPWPQIAGMRNRVVHEYRRVDLDEVWRTAEEEIPKLVSDIQRLLPEAPPPRQE